MKAFKLDSNGDLIINNGDFVMVEGSEELRQSIDRILTTNIREWFLDIDFGLDYDAIRGKGKSRQGIELALRNAIFQDERIDEVIFHKIDFNRVARHLEIEFDAIAGEEVIEGLEVII